MKHEFKHRVIYQDTDAEGVVYYANYLGFFERGRTELLRSKGVSLTEMKEKQGILFAISEVACKYHSPALYDDEIAVTTKIEETTKARVIFKQEVLRGEALLVSARITACALDTKSFKPLRLPAKLAIRDL